MIYFQSLSKALAQVEKYMELHGELIQTQRWQGIELAEVKGSKMVEVLHYNFAINIPNSKQEIKDTLKPNLPWCDDHFQERVCGFPINPGVEWKNWPWAGKASESLDSSGQFNHNYMERYWPRFASYGYGIATDNSEEFKKDVLGYFGVGDFERQSGIKEDYGDLDNLVSLLYKEPDTRQAYLPVWFPEDTGDVHSGRKPCTLGYHFIIRNRKLDIVYHIRSCDLYRHFRDDVYLTILLGEWILGQLAKKFSVEHVGYKNPFKHISLGRLSMNITSLHMFENDYLVKYKHKPKE